MSSSFEIVEQALATLGGVENLRPDQKAALEAIQRVVVEWHLLNHKQQDFINLRTSPGAIVGVVDTRRRLAGPSHG